jgi:GNAT superfamily N-acetyltransferase
MCWLLVRSPGSAAVLYSLGPCLRLHHERAHIRYDWDVKERGEHGEDPKEARFTIRPGKRDDAAEAARLWMRSAEEHALYDHVYTTAANAEKTMRRFLADLCANSYSCLFVAEKDGGMIGFLSGELREGSPAFKPKTWVAVEDVYVISDHRSTGVGRALFEECQKWARRKGADGVSLQAAAGNARARKFYEELGFREVSVYQVKEF